MSVNVTRLPSGLTVVTDQMAHLQTASLGVWISSGSRDEHVHEHGIAHLLEHMAFKGTSRRNARQIAEEIEAVGGDLNAATSAETTVYYARVLKADVPLALDILADILQDPTFAADELTREQNVIVQEIGASEDNPDDIVFEFLQATAFPNQSIGRSILGTRESVCSFNGRDLRQYLHRNYSAPEMVIAAAGAIEHDAIVAEVIRRFGRIIGVEGAIPHLAKFHGGAKIERRDLEQVHVALALEGVPLKNPEFYSLQAFTSVLGGGMSSRLFQEAREKRGLCYTISAYHMPYSDIGMFGLYAGTDARDLGELMQVVVDEIGATAADLSETEIARAKAQMKTGLLMALESSGARAEQIARHMIVHGRPIPLNELVERVESVTVESARAAGRALIARNRPAIAALGPGSGLERAVAIVDSLGQSAPAALVTKA